MRDRVEGTNQPDELAQLQAEMDNYVGHQRARLNLITAILAASGILLAIGHARSDSGALGHPLGGLAEVLIGYPNAFMLSAAAMYAWSRAGLYSG